MRFIIIGLGTFGTSLGCRLVDMGHEVIGMDSREQVVEEYKNRFTGAVVINATDELAMRDQPVNEVDAVIVAIGEDWAASIQATALLKKLGVKNIIGRSLSSLHEMVLHGLNVSEVVNPEYEAAITIASKLVSHRVKATYRLTDDIAIYEIDVPNEFNDIEVKSCNFPHYDMNLVCVKRTKTIKDELGKEVNKVVAVDHTGSGFKFHKGDTMVVSASLLGFNDFADTYLK